MTANPVGFFQHRDPMTAFCRDQCRLHASRTGTNDKYMLLIPGRRQRPFMFETDIGIHGAANRLAIARPQEATLKIADTGTDIAGLIVPALDRKSTRLNSR